MPNEDSWKEQLTLVSGNILIWGVVLLKLWPIASGLQTGQHVQYFSSVGPRGEDLVLKFLTDIMGLAVGVTASAILHILCRGMWLVSIGSSLERMWDGICRFTFNCSIFLMAFIVIAPFFSLPAIYIQLGTMALLMSTFHITHKIANIIASGAAIAFTLLLFFVLLKIVEKRFPLKPFLASLVGPGTFLYLLALLMFAALGFFTIQGCYTLELRANTAICDLDRSDIVEIYVTLGGATSSASEAKLKLLNSAGVLTKNLELQDLGEGHYVSYILSPTLAEGSYRVLLEYPQRSLSVFFPFVQSRSQKTVGFVVIHSSNRQHASVP